MIALIQRVTEASVRVDGEVIGQIGPGLLALVAVEPGDDAVALLQERREALVASYALHHDGLASARAKGVPPQVLVEIERQEALLDAELRWLDSLLTRLDGDELRWGPDAFDDTDRYRAQRKAAQQ